MTMTLSGDGTITGLSAGGLPDGSITTADIADANITAAKLDGAQSGSAPIYAARAWVNFNGTGTVAIRASGNVSSITDMGTGDYIVNFATAMPDTNYAAAFSSGNLMTGGTYTPAIYIDDNAYTPATTGFRMRTVQTTTQTAYDPLRLLVSIFR